MRVAVELLDLGSQLVLGVIWIIEYAMDGFHAKVWILEWYSGAW